LPLVRAAFSTRLFNAGFTALRRQPCRLVISALARVS
jgi:hypothetical protein